MLNLCGIDSLPNLEPKIGPPLYITEEMISKATAKMKTSKAAGPSGIVIEMIRSPNLLQTLQTELSRKAVILQIGTFYVLSVYTRVKEDNLSRDNCRHLKMLDQVMKIIERVLDSVRTQTDIDIMKVRVHTYNACICSVLLYVSETHQK